MMIPKDVDFKIWANSLFIDFPTDNIPSLQDEKEWKEWGSDLVQTTSFSENNAPSPNSYEDSFKWAQDVFYSMNNN